MKDYKVIKLKIKVFSTSKIDELIQDELNKHSRTGWTLDKISTGQFGMFLIFSKPKMM